MADVLAAARDNLPKRSRTYPGAESDQHATYRVAHSARCKLQLAADRPDRNLRFVLGHAFTLDNLLLRIVEIENQGAKDQLDLSKPDEPAPKGESEYQQHDDTHSGIGGGAGVQVGERGSLARDPSKQSSSPRRVSFSGSSNFSPSAILKGQSKAGAGRRRPKSPPPAGHEDDGASTSSDDDIDDPRAFAESFKPKSVIPPQGKGANAHDSDSYSDDDYEDDNDTGLQRFESASAKPPRQRSPPPENVPELEEDEGDEEDEPEPVSPPSLPEDKIREALAGDVDEEMAGLYSGIKKCSCHHHHKLAPNLGQMYDVKGFDGEPGKRYAIIKAEA